MSYVRQLQATIPDYDPPENVADVLRLASSLRTLS